MRKITFKGLLCGLFFLIGSGVGATFLTYFLSQMWPMNDVVYFFSIYLFYFLINILFFRIFLTFCSSREGSLSADPRLEWMYDTYLTQALFCFHWITESKLFPIPIRTVMIKALGAKLGKDTFPSGAITDPFLFSAGDGCVIGYGSILTCHAAVAGQVKLAKVELGDRVTIGGNALVYPGVKIGSNSIVAGGAIVLENQVIPPNEIWGGVPAKFIKKINAD